MSLTSIFAREPASVVSVWPTAIRPSPISRFEPMRGVPMMVATPHDAGAGVAPAEVDAGAMFFQVRPTISMIAAAVASAGPRNRTPRYVAVRTSEFPVVSGFSRTVIRGGAFFVLCSRPSICSSRTTSGSGSPAPSKR